jgi:hypothetical protein
LIVLIVLYRRPFLTRDGKIGKGWNSIKQGDLVCVIFGCDVPLVLRPVEEHYYMIGDCYVEGIMQGEAMRNFENEQAEPGIFDIH